MQKALIEAINQRARSAQRSASPSLVTFFGLGKKVTRLPAGTGDFKL